MKKAWSLILVLALLLALTVPALAFEKIRRSTQFLSVNGELIDCDKYNIDGSNYFKLRDLAYVLNGTGSQFDVGYNTEKKLISITTNHAYTQPNGTELVVGEDLSSTAVDSPQTIMIDGEIRTDLTAYNIGKNNYFKLKELGEALGFDVDYDTETRTMLVTSRETPAASGTLDVPSRITMTDGNGNVTCISTFTYDGKGNCLKVEDRDQAGNLLGEETYEYYPDGTERSYLYRGSSGEEYSATYDSKGNPTSSSSKDEEGRITDSMTATYDANGNELTRQDDIYNYDTSEDGWGNYESHWKYTSTYNAAGLLATQREEYQNVDHSDDSTYTTLTETAYTYDAAGNLIRESYTETSGGDWGRTEESGSRDYTYDAAGKLLKEVAKTTSTSYYGDEEGYTSESTATTTYSYNGSGQPILEVTVDEYGSTQSTRTYTYNAAGDLLTDKTENSYGMTTTWTYTYDEAGQMLKREYEFASEYFTNSSTNTYRFDSEGQCVWQNYVSLSDGEITWEITTERTFDAQGRVTVVKNTDSDSGVSISTYEY